MFPRVGSGSREGELGGGAAGGYGGGELLDGFRVGVHDDLEAGPEEHVDSVDVGVCDWDFAALELEGEVLVQADAEEDSEAVVTGGG